MIRNATAADLPAIDHVFRQSFGDTFGHLYAPHDLADFLASNGDPYERIGSDPESKVQISLGSSGVPESFVVDGKGVIRYQQIGPIERSDVPMILSKLEQAR